MKCFLVEIANGERVFIIILLKKIGIYNLKFLFIFVIGNGDFVFFFCVFVDSRYV